MWDASVNFHTEVRFWGIAPGKPFRVGNCATCGPKKLGLPLKHPTLWLQKNIRPPMDGQRKTTASRPPTINETCLVEAIDICAYLRRLK